jgi:hypothetical protein
MCAIGDVFRDVIMRGDIESRCTRFLSETGLIR